jgi:hypothetical protein
MRKKTLYLMFNIVALVSAVLVLSSYWKIG